MSATSDRNDISTEPSPGPDENDNLGAEDGKGEPPAVPPASGDGSEDDHPADDPHADQLIEDETTDADGAPLENPSGG